MIGGVLLVQGGSDGAYEADQALAESLRRELGSGYEVRYPAMPEEAEPDYEAWKGAILSEVADLGEGALVVGHSIGASILIRLFLDQEPVMKVCGLFLISGPFWYDHEFWRWDEVALPANAADLFSNDVPLFLYHGEEDQSVPLSHLDMYASAFPDAVVRRLPGRDHQLNNDMTEVARDIVALCTRSESLDGADRHQLSGKAQGELP